MIIIGGFRSGLFTPTEAGAVAAFYALFVAVVIYRELTFSSLYHVLVNAAKTTSVVMFLVAAARIRPADYDRGITHDGVRFAAAAGRLSATLIYRHYDLNYGRRYGDGFDANGVNSYPVLLPLVKEANIDPIYFGVMFIINCSIGLITPPVGNVLNVISGVAKLKFDDAVRGVFPYVVVLMSLLVLFIFIPELIITPLKWIN